MNMGLGFAVDRLDMQRNIFLRLFYFIAVRIVYRFSVTQMHTVYKQLRLGARYLDLRVGLRPEDRNYYIVHNLYGPRIEDILVQVSNFLEQHTREVVVLDFQHLHGFRSVADHQRLKAIIARYLDMSKVIASAEVANAKDLTLERIWSQRKQVIIIYRHAYQERPECRELYCHRGLLPNPWPNTTNPKKLFSFLRERLVERSQPDQQLSLFVTQGVLTPHTKFVLLHAFDTLRSLLAPKSNAVILKLLNNIYETPSSPSMANNDSADTTTTTTTNDDDNGSNSSSSSNNIDKFRSKPFGANIIMVDFFGSNQHDVGGGEDLVKLCNRLNRYYFF